MSFFNRRSISVFTLTMINVAAIGGLKNYPTLANYGLEIIVFYLIGSLLFFIPTSLVSAELATGWPKIGGVYVWVKEALGPKMGFLAIWLQWAENAVWYPTILSFASGTLAYIINPNLAHNNLYTILVITTSFWFFTIVNSLGMKISGLISSIGVCVGTIVPTIIIVALGSYWPFTGNPMNLHLAFHHIIPDFSKEDIALLVGIIASLTGMEMSAVHAQDVQNPQKNYPLAILFSSLIIFASTVLGSLAIAMVVPQQDISLVAGIMQAFEVFFNSFNLAWMIPIIAGLTVVGAFVMVSTWIVGPSKGLLACAQSGELPRIFEKVNKHNMPVPLMIFQAIFVTIFSFAFLFMPNVSNSYWILTVLMAQIYMIMYLLMFISAIVLRYKQPWTSRSYKIPGGNWGMWITGITGCIACLLAIGVGFIPPFKMDKSYFLLYEGFLIGGLVLMCSIPLIFSSLKKVLKF